MGRGGRGLTRPVMSVRRPWPILALMALLGACARMPVENGGAGTSPPLARIQACERLFSDLDSRVEHARVRDPGAYAVADFPYLRTDRFLASFRDRVPGHRFVVWVGRLARLDHEGRHFELANLPRDVRAGLPLDIERRLDRCRGTLVARDVASPARRSLLRRNAQAPDEYSTWERVLGIYPITSLFVSFRIKSLQDEFIRWHRSRLGNGPVSGRPRRWGLAARASSTVEGPRWPLDGLGIPVPGRVALEALFRRYAPVWEIDERDGDDRPGRPVWSAGRPVIDVRAPTLYRWVSWTRYREASLLQLNYLIWFPRRPGDDLYSGEVDGLIWRVTLGPDGRAWVYDSIHACGCYYIVFPTERLPYGVPRRRWFTEDLTIPKTLPADPPGPIVLRVASGTHYLVHADPRPSRPSLDGTLAVQAYDELRSLPYEPPERPYRGLFAPNGLVPGTERRERYLLWPMGILSPGAMRIRGRHAIAFIGRRHFDDARLVEEVIEAWGRHRFGDTH